MKAGRKGMMCAVNEARKQLCYDRRRNSDVSACIQRCVLSTGDEGEGWVVRQLCYEERREECWGGGRRKEEEDGRKKNEKQE